MDPVNPQQPLVLVVAGEAHAREKIQHALNTLGQTRVQVVPDESAAIQGLDAIAMSSVRRFAHEAAAPLLIVTMMSELLQDDETLTESQVADLRKIQDAAARLSRMLKDLKSGQVAGL